MEDKTNLELRIICKKLGLSQKGGKNDMIARIKKSGKKLEEPKRTKKKKSE